MALSTVTVTWDENDPTLSGVQGTVTFSLSTVLTDTADRLIVHPVPKSYALSLGTSQPLVANDNSSALPTGSYYTITVQTDDGAFYSFQAQLNHSNGSTQSLASLVPLTAPPATVSSLPLPSGTPLANQVPFATGTGEASAWGAASARAGTTGASGFALQNATPVIVSWTAPNDGQMHRFNVSAILHVSSAETGGLVQVTFTDAAGNPASATLFAAGLGLGDAGNSLDRLAAPGTVVSIIQSSVLSAGAAILYAELWAS